MPDPFLESEKALHRAQTHYENMGPDDDIKESEDDIPDHYDLHTEEEEEKWRRGRD